MAYDTFHELRQVIEGDDPFMNRGHRIRKIRRPQHDVPNWTRNDSEVNQVLLRSFPKLKRIGLDLLVAARAKKRKRKNARTPHDKYIARVMRWRDIIILYFRMGRSRPEIAQHLGISESTVGSLIRNILRAGDGFRTDGNPRVRTKSSVIPKNEYGV